MLLVKKITTQVPLREITYLSLKSVKSAGYRNLNKISRLGIVSQNSRLGILNNIIGLAYSTISDTCEIP